MHSRQSGARRNAAVAALALSLIVALLPSRAMAATRTVFDAETGIELETTLQSAVHVAEAMETLDARGLSYQRLSQGGLDSLLGDEAAWEAVRHVPVSAPAGATVRRSAAVVLLDVDDIVEVIDELPAGDIAGLAQAPELFIVATRDVHETTITEALSIVSASDDMRLEFTTELRTSSVQASCEDEYHQQCGAEYNDSRGDNEIACTAAGYLAGAVVTGILGPFIGPGLAGFVGTLAGAYVTSICMQSTNAIALAAYTACIEAGYAECNEPPPPPDPNPCDEQNPCDPTPINPCKPGGRICG